jgi:hypothetical protein
MSDSEIGREVNCAHCSKPIPSSAVRCRYCLRSVYETPESSLDTSAPTISNGQTFGIRQKIAGSLLIGVMVLVLGVYFVRKVHYVNIFPSVDVANQYFSDLKAGNVETAFAIYDDEFRRTYGAAWLDLLSRLQKQYGVVTEFKLLESRIVPVSDVGCALVRFNVTRGQLVSEEGMVLCPNTKSEPKIVGHEMMRVDTHQRMAAGRNVVEIGVRFPPK